MGVLQAGQPFSHAVELCEIDLRVDPALAPGLARDDLSPGVDHDRLAVGLALGAVLADLRRATTQHWFSIARARSSGSQWNGPV